MILWVKVEKRRDQLELFSEEKTEEKVDSDEARR